MFLRLIHIVGDRHAGFILCMIVVLNLIIGSLMMNANPQLYPPFFPLDLKFFFQPARVEHIWLHALLVTFTLFGINLLACTINSILRLINNQKGRLKASAALLFHVALVSTMGAHLYEGINATTVQTMLTVQGLDLPEAGHVQVESLQNSYYPDNSLKDTRVTLLVSPPDGQPYRKEIAFNEPALFDGGRRQVVMLSGQQMPAGVVMKRSADGQAIRLTVNAPHPLDNGSLTLQRFLKNSNGLPYAAFIWQDSGGNQQQLFMALAADQPEAPHIQIADARYDLEEIIETPFIVAIIRHNPAVPLILVSLLLASVATALLIKWLAGRFSAGASASPR